MNSSRIHIHPITCSRPLFVLFIAFTTLSCTSSSNIKELHLSTAFKKYTAAAKVDTSRFVRIPLCDLVSETNWDEFAILRPYVADYSIDSLKIENISHLEDAIDSLGREDRSLLIFSQNKVAKAYALVKHDQLNTFGMLGSNQGNLIHVFNKSVCDSLVLKSDGGEVILFREDYVKRFVKSPIFSIVK